MEKINNFVFPDTLEKLTIKNISYEKNENTLIVNNLPQSLKIFEITSSDDFIINLPDYIITVEISTSYNIDFHKSIISNKKYFVSQCEIGVKYNSVNREYTLNFYDENII